MTATHHKLLHDNSYKLRSLFYFCSELFGSLFGCGLFLNFMTRLHGEQEKEDDLLNTLPRASSLFGFRHACVMLYGKNMTQRLLKAAHTAFGLIVRQ